MLLHHEREIPNSKFYIYKFILDRTGSILKEKKKRKENVFIPIE